MLAHATKIVEEVQRTLERLPDWLRRYVIALAALGSAVGLAMILIHTVGTKAALLYGFMYFVVIGGAAWLGYGPGLLVCTITTYVLPPLLFGRPPRVDPSRFGLLVIISFLISRISTSTRRTEASLRRAADDLAEQSKELLKSQQANETQARLLQCILDSMGDGVVVADENGKFILFNPAAEKILGIGPLDTTPDQWSDDYGCFLPDAATPYPANDLPLARAIRGETVNNAQIFVRHSGLAEGIWIDVTAQPLVEGQSARRGGVAVLRDVSSIKRTQETMQQARKDAEEANRAKSEFLSRMSHELRTPLNAILGFAQLLEIDALNAPQHQSVDQILKGGRHLLTLINEVLDLARIEAGKLTLSTEPIQIDEAMHSSIDLIAQLARERDIQVRTALSSCGHQYVLADRHRLQQVILNLLSNAIKYNKTGGCVSISCGEAEQNRWRLQVRDTGMGLSPAKVAHLFTPFDRLGAEEAGIEGTGIGLALSKKLVEAMGGQIGVQSEEGKGSAFWIELPRAECPLDAYERQLANDSLAGPISNGGHVTTVLYVEDNLSNLLLMERILENRPDVKLISAMQGRLGLELARQHRPDLIFLDVHLPDLPGSEVLRCLQADAETSNIPVAVISADATPGQIDRLLAAGAHTYLTKPLDIKRLLEFVDEMLATPA